MNHAPSCASFFIISCFVFMAGCASSATDAETQDTVSQDIQPTLSDRSPPGSASREQIDFTVLDLEHALTRWTDEGPEIVLTAQKGDRVFLESRALVSQGAGRFEIVVFYDDSLVTHLKAEPMSENPADLVVSELSGLEVEQEYKIAFLFMEDAEALTPSRFFDTLSNNTLHSIHFSENEIPNQYIGVNKRNEFDIEDTLPLRVPAEFFLSRSLLNLEENDAQISWRIREKNSEAMIAEGPEIDLMETVKLPRQDTTYIVELRRTYPHGLRGLWSPDRELEYAPQMPLRIGGPFTGEVMISGNAHFFWQETAFDIPVFFELEWKPDTVSSKSILIQENNGAVTAILRDYFPNIASGDRLRWRVKVANSPSDSLTAVAVDTTWQEIQYLSLLDDWIPVVVQGESFTFLRGRDDGKPDEKPAHMVTLDEPVIITRSPIDNLTASILLNRLLSRSVIAIDGEQVIDTSGKLIAGLGRLNYGNQFGLTVDSQSLIRPIRGKENHPATGISWHGARIMAVQAAKLIGYSSEKARLPREAEYEFIASLGGRSPSPWFAVPNARTVNFLRSNDAFEDPVSPHIRKGGPTVPNGYFDGQRRSVVPARSLASNNPLGQRFSRADMLGNVWEWCMDRYSSIEYQRLIAMDESDLRNPSGPANPQEAGSREIENAKEEIVRSVRGGAWNSALSEIYPQNRGRFPELNTSFSIGFRIVLSHSID